MSDLKVKKANRIYTSKWVFFIMPAILICSGFLLPIRENDNEAIDRVFGKQLEKLLLSVDVFEKSFEKKSSATVIKKNFKSARLAYKEAAILIDYYYPYDAKLLNSAALPSATEDPRVIIEPHGFQVIEELVYEPMNDSNRIVALKEIKEIKRILLQFKQQPNRSYKFKNNLVLDAIRMSLIRMVSTGISGFDSPVATYSIEEAGATLQGIKSLIDAYDRGTIIIENIENAINYTNAHKNFNRFDRLTFITEHVNPIYAMLAGWAHTYPFKMDDEKRPVNPLANSIFSDTFLNAGFFGPSSRFEQTGKRIELGKKLFFDSILSSSKTRSCATCHKPELAFTDGLKTAIALDGKSYLARNTPTLWNSGLQTKQFYDSRAAMLEHQLNAVVHNEQEMGGSLAQSAKDLEASSIYKELFQKAYPNEPEQITQYTIANAISSYVRSLVSLNSRFDLYMRGDATQLSDEEKKGFNLFMGKAKCGTCHFAPLFNGLVPPLFTETESEVLGVPANKEKGSPLDADEGKATFTKSPVHRYAFKTPTLRNIALTAPYMHNGVFDSLEEVMDFYNKGGGKGLNIAPGNQTLPFDKLSLSRKEIKAVIAFLRTLTDNKVPTP